MNHRNYTFRWSTAPAAAEQSSSTLNWFASLAYAVVVLSAVFAAQAAQAQTFLVIHNFTVVEGGNPHAGVTLDKAGNLYGTVVGAAGYGMVYQLKHKGSGWHLNTLYTFTGGSDGSDPEAGVIFGPDGALYGTTTGGAGIGGVVFKLTPSLTACKTALCPWTETVLHTFSGYPDGEEPERGDLLFDQAGNIYGTTSGGGTYGAGTVYQLQHSGSGWMENVLYSFTGFGDGEHPYNGLTADNAGNLYSTTASGGGYDCDGYGCGTVFQLTPSGLNVIYTFQNESDGAYPHTGVILDQSGNVYGNTGEEGGFPEGSVFELSPSDGGWTFSLLWGFDGANACGPQGNLAMDQAGNLFGTTLCNGANGYGNVFKLTRTSQAPWAYTSLHDFSGNDGAYPIGKVTLDTNGNLYGTTSGGGTTGRGVVWEITP